MIHTPYAQMHGAGWKARSEAAQVKIDKARDPKVLAVAAVRERMRDLHAARSIAEAEFAETHAPVPCPLPQAVHRDVADHLRAFLLKSGLDGVDLLAPLNAHETVDVIEVRHRERLQADLEEAQAELTRVEREEALGRLREAQAALEAVEASHARQEVAKVVVVPVEAPPQVPLIERVERALAEQATVGPDPLPAAVSETPRRPRGRPPKVIVDREAGDTALFESDD